jgi:cellulose synthase/poly-beta-1,6-N-acetylglucosamine synthase-like glycosyltransferase
VSGRLVLTDPRTGRNVDSVYWRYETFLKQCEGRLGGLLGANGAIYAIRRSLFEPLRAGTIVDDFMVPLVARMRSGCRIVYDAHAVAHEETPADLSMEFRRRARIGVGGFQALATLWPLLSPRHGWTAFTFWSHKVMRWISPFLLVAMLLSSLLLISQPLFRIALVAQVAFYASCFVGTMLPPANRVARVLRIFGMFAAMNLALLTGFFRWLVSSQSGIWKRTERVPAAA